MDTLTSASLDWALQHLRKFGDTDIFPAPFEIEAVKHNWQALQKKLMSLDLATYRIGAIRRTLVPKPNAGFRVATQLDPLDSLVYTALVYEAAEAIEQSRVSLSQRVACSYRIKLDAGGSFFRSDNGWSDFQQRSSELANSGSFTHVLFADVSDFYNQIYHHRLENALADANLSDERRRNIIKFISQLTAAQSRGIPVGPYASIVLAEACLNDVDVFLLRKGYTHVRYVDDFRIFCPTERNAFTVLHDLSEYLYTSQRLSLEPSKIRVIPVKQFVTGELFDPEQVEKQGQASAIAKLAEQLRAEAGYGEDDEASEDKASRKILKKAVQDNLVALFETCTSQSPLHLGFARYILRRAAQSRTKALLPLVFGNLQVLAPILRDVANYVRASLPRRNTATYGAQLKQFLTSSPYADIPYVRMWCLEMALNSPKLMDAATALRLADDSAACLGIRPAALLARVYNQATWVRAHKETWRSNGDWDRRAIIWASSVLPADERKHWLKGVKQATDGLDRAIAELVATT